MPISFSCSCGKQMKGKEEFAGRKLKCPDCGRAVTIPNPPKGGRRLPVAMPVGKAASPNRYADLFEEDADDDAVEEQARPAPRLASELFNPWIDASLNGQRATPWLPGDEADFQAGMRPPREGLSGTARFLLTILTLAAILAALAFAIPYVRDFRG